MTPDSFTREVAPLRRELLAHCYRMLGSPHEAEDAVQETYLRAWRAHGSFEHRSSVRTWLYRIATNTCLSALALRGGRRVLPSDLSAPAADPGAPAVPDRSGAGWLGPLPDDPAVVVESRETLRLAFIAGLQFLPARQRAVLLLRDAAGLPAAEVAETLGISVAAVKSALQRARARLREERPAPEELLEPADERARALLDLYIAAFERSDVELLRRVLRADARLEIAGSATWFSGIGTCLPFLARPEVIGTPGRWRMLPASANHQPAARIWLDGGPYGMAVLSATADGLTRIVLFADPRLAAP